jgi:hypothetical protein
MAIRNLPLGHIVLVSVIVPSGELPQFYLTNATSCRGYVIKHSQMTIQQGEQVELARERSVAIGIIHLVQFVWFDQARAVLSTTQLEFESRSHKYETSAGYRQHRANLGNTVLNLQTSQITKDLG